MGASPPAAPRPRAVLLVSPSLQGHRLIYCRVLARIFTRAGARVLVAGDIADAGLVGHPLLSDLGGWPGVDLADSGPAAAFSAAALPDLLAASGADLLFCADADGLIGDPAARPARAGRTGLRAVGLYVRTTNYVHAAPDPWLRRLRGALAGRGDAPRSFHERGPAADGLIDAALVLDERFAATHPRTHLWMPDIFREGGDDDGPEPQETVVWRERLEGFLARSPERPVISYVGTNQERRGYDALLRLAVAEDAVFIHCGRLSGHDGPDPGEVERLRGVLRDRGALFETAGTYEHAATADLFLRAARCVVLPYRHHDGSSGVMLQAIAAGRPVLVPDRGLMAFRAQTFGLGATYAHGDERAMRRAFRAAVCRRPEAYASRLGAFIRCFSGVQLQASVTAAVTGEGPGAELPQQALAAPSLAGGAG